MKKQTKADKTHQKSKYDVNATTITKHNNTILKTTNTNAKQGKMQLIQNNKKQAKTNQTWT